MAVSIPFLKALDMLPPLRQCAKDKTTITYQELGALVGISPNFLSAPLDILRDRILIEHHLPRIDALAIDKETGEVGDNFLVDGREGISDKEFKKLIKAEREKVYAYERWDEIVSNLQMRYGGEAYHKKKNKV